jgi:hypothetical protein
MPANVSWFSRTTHVGIKDGRMVDDPVIPNCHIIGLPSPTTSSVSQLCEAVPQELQRRVSLGFGHSDQPGHETRVDEYTLQSSHWMNADNRVDSLDRLASRYGGDGAARSGLVVSGVKCREGLEVYLVRSREGRVQCISANELVSRWVLTLSSIGCRHRLLVRPITSKWSLLGAVPRR